MCHNPKCKGWCYIARPLHSASWRKKLIPMIYFQDASIDWDRQEVINHYHSVKNSLKLIYEVSNRVMRAPIHMLIKPPLRSPQEGASPSMNTVENRVYAPCFRGAPALE